MWFIIFGLILLAVGTTVFAIATWRSGALIKWIGIPFGGRLCALHSDLHHLLPSHSRGQD